MEDGERRLGAVRPRQRDQHAVGAERDHRHAGLVRPEARPRACPGAGLGAVDDRGVRLVPERERSSSAPTVEQSRRRFSSTRSTSSPVRRPRFSDSNGPSLTPPRRVEKTTSYGPAPPSRRPERSCPLDELPRSCELRLPAVELAVQLPASQLGEDLPHSRRFAEPEAATSSPVISSRIREPLEVVVEPGGRSEQGQERRVRRVRLRGDDVGGEIPSSSSRSAARR